MILDKWQKKVLATEGNLCLCSGRQVGKSTVIAIKAGEQALKKSNQVIMIIASVERQALLLFEKVLSHIHAKNKQMICTGKKKPTKHKLQLKNGSVIHCLPTGDSGYGIRGYTIDHLYADEAHFIGEEVWAAVTPMLATTGGTINLLSTPFGCEGYFHRCFHDPKFTAIHVNTETVAKGREDPQKTRMLEFLKDEKLRMTKLQYQQEYLGLFVGGIQRLFTDDLIIKCCTGTPHKPPTYCDKYMGVDIARMGGDETVLTYFSLIKKVMLMYGMDIPEGQTLTDTTRLILHRNRQNDFKIIYIDTTGMGWGGFDPLKEHDDTKRKVVAIENVKKSLDREKGAPKDQRKKTMKEDLYNNLVNLMQTNKIILLNNPEVKQSLKSIQYTNEDGKLKIFGNYTHITESIIRAAWAVKDKSLNIYIY